MQNMYPVYVNTKILYITQSPVFYLKYVVSETGFCLHVQAKTNQS
jgi:hypothetical protein